MNYANAANSGKFVERLPYLFDFLKSFVPNDPFEIVRAMFDLPSPYDDGSLKFDYTSDRYYIGDTFYIPHFIYQLIITVNIAIVSTIIGGTLAFCLCFFAATNLVGAGAVRWFVRRSMEVMRAFPEIVIAGLLTAVLSIGPIAAMTFTHKHLPEMTAYTGLSREPLFVPTVGDFAQGMTTFVPLQLGHLGKVPTGREIHAAIADHFAAIKDSFVVVAPFSDAAKTPALDPQAHNNTNTMTLHVFANDARAQAVLVAVYDNLGKGASGAAVQNLNLMLGVNARESLAA